MKWLVDTMGIDELRRRILKERKLLLASSHAGRAASRRSSQERGDAPAGLATGVEPTPVGRPVTLRLGPGDPHRRWETANVVVGVAKGTVSAYAYARLGRRDRPTSSGSWPPSSGSSAPRSGSPTARTWSSGAWRHDSCRRCYARLAAIGMAEPGAELARDVVGLPGRRHLQPGRDPEPWPGRRHRPGPRGGRPGRRRRDPGQHLRLHQLAAASTTSPTSGSTASSGGPTASPRPGYQMLLGGHIGQTEVEFGQQGAAAAGQGGGRSDRPGGRPLRRRAGGRRDLRHLARPGRRRRRARQGPQGPRRLAHPEERPDYYVDFGETGPYVADVGEGECAAA